MGVLEQIKQMQSQGMPDEDIITQLQEKGVSPREINDALNQSQIKRAVIDEKDSNAPPMPQQNQEDYTPQQQETQEQMPEENYPPQQQEYSQAPQQEYYQEGGYEGYPQTSDNDTIIEIAEQVFSEKIKNIQKQVENSNEFKTLAETKIENLSDRLKRIETIIDRLQVTILEKIGSYGENLESIKKEMSMMQDSFGKVVNQAVKGHKTSSTKSSEKETKKRSSKK